MVKIHTREHLLSTCQRLCYIIGASRFYRPASRFIQAQTEEPYASDYHVQMLNVHVIYHTNCGLKKSITLLPTQMWRWRCLFFLSVIEMLFKSSSAVFLTWTIRTIYFNKIQCEMWIATAIPISQWIVWYKWHSSVRYAIEAPNIPHFINIFWHFPWNITFFICINLLFYLPNKQLSSAQYVGWHIIIYFIDSSR